jgi:hypothetical protein
MADIDTPVVRAFVAAALLLAIATLMAVAINTSRAAGVSEIGACGAYRDSFDLRTAAVARSSALAKCAGGARRIVTTLVTPPLQQTAPVPAAAIRVCYQGNGAGCVAGAICCDTKI